MVEVVCPSAPYGQRGLAKLANALRGRRVLYLLGAGTSAPYVPLGPELAQRARDADRNGCSVLPIEHDERARTLLGLAPKIEVNGPEDLFRLELVDRIPNIDMQLRPLYYLATVETPAGGPPAYRVFAQFPRTLLLNFNHDELAERHCRPRHRVISVHGSINSSFGTPEVASWIETLSEEDGQSLDIPGLTFIEREPASVRNCLPRSLSSFDLVVLVGYSFARVGRELQDSVTFEHLVCLLDRDPRPVIVIDPYQDFFAGSLEDVTGVRCHWARLSWHQFARTLIGMDALGCDLRTIGREYFRAELNEERRGA